MKQFRIIALISLIWIYACQPATNLASRTANTSTPTQALEISKLLEKFPLYPGSSWSFTKTNYTQAGSDPDTILNAVMRVDERVLDTHPESPYFFVHLQRITTLVRVDPGYENYDSLANLGLGDFEFWYIVLNGRVYFSSDQPDPAVMRLDQLDEEYDFPMTVGSSWCPNKRQKGSLTPVAETPVPCASAGSRKVMSEQTYQTQAGNYDRCHQLADFYNSGGVNQWFCDGVGIVAQKYGHSGTRFGFSQELVKFTRGSLP